MSIAIIRNMSPIFKSILMVAFFVLGIHTLNAQDTDTTASQFDAEDGVDLSVKLEPEATKKEVPWFANVPDELIQDRLLCIQKDIKFTYNRTIKGFINYFTVRRPQYCLVMERRKNLYFPIFEPILKKNGIPEEMKYLAIVESGLNPKAVSRAGAVGLWQFMPVTGRQYGLMINEFIDERMDLVKSTEAACKYLGTANNIFKDWELSIASYNCGMGHVRRSIRRSGYADTFWDVYEFLPQETRSYVPQYVAINYVMNYLKEHQIMADSIEAPIVADTLRFRNQYVNIPKLCNLLDFCIADFIKINPAIQKNYLPPHLSHFPILVPKDKINIALSNFEAFADSCSYLDHDSLELPIVPSKTGMARIANNNSQSQNHKKYHLVKRGQTIYKICQMYGVSVDNLKSWNNLRSSKLKAGQRLTIFKASKTSSPKENQMASIKKSHISNKEISKTRQRVHYVQPGDTLWNISQRYDGITVSRIKKLNRLKSNDLKIGQKLIIG